MNTLDAIITIIGAYLIIALIIGSALGRILKDERKRWKGKAMKIADYHTLAELEALPTIAQGQADDLKIETNNKRVWLSRCGVEDGMPYDNAVTVERLVDGRWIEAEQYPAK